HLPVIPANLLFRLVFGEHVHRPRLSAAAGEPVAPAKRALWRTRRAARTRVVRTIAIALRAMLAALATRARQTDILALAAESNGSKLLRIANELTNLSATWLRIAKQKLVGRCRNRLQQANYRNTYYLQFF